MGENNHFGVTSQNIFSQSQKYFDTTFIYFLQFSSKLEMLISFKWKVWLRKCLKFSKGYTLKIISQDFFSCWNSFLLKWHSLAHSALSGPPTLMISILMKVSLLIKKNSSTTSSGGGLVCCPNWLYDTFSSRLKNSLQVLKAKEY